MPTEAKGQYQTPSGTEITGSGATWHGSPAKAVNALPVEPSLQLPR